MENTSIPNLGTVFQRWKIILEKCTHHSNGKSDMEKVIYLIDDFLYSLQAMIYYHIEHIINNFLSLDIKYFIENFHVLPEFYSERKYLKILLEVNNCNSFLHKTMEINQDITLENFKNFIAFWV